METTSKHISNPEFANQSAVAAKVMGYASNDRVLKFHGVYTIEQFKLMSCHQL